ncbi:MAG TPA: hypothetical protein PLQ97_02825 [Myxococcota bacterium]|nr:hypothetical protein [Myxococcota bacterium]HQK50763.1 hypothetical protein [Myxococcota bacterium]
MDEKSFVESLGWKLLTSNDPKELSSVLSRIVVELLIEVEAMRKALASIPACRDQYKSAYYKTRVLSHNSAGVLPGYIKVLCEMMENREEKWLQILGASTQEVSKFEEECEFVKQLS